jgi:transposase
VRSIGLDVHQGFCEVAICEGATVRSAGRVKTARADLELLAQSLGPQDRVVLEASGPAFAVARILAPHVAEVVVVNAAEVRAISHARVKSDRFDARTLARLLHADMLRPVWVPTAEIGALRRRVARRSALVRQRTMAKNEVHAALSRCLLGRSPASDLFGIKGRKWLGAQELPAEEAETVSGCLRQVDFLDGEIAMIDRALATFAVSSPEVRRLMTIPGIGVATAVALVAAIGDIARFASARELVGYLGLDPTSRQSGDQEPRGGRISKRGNAHARSVLVEAAWVAIRTPGPLRAFGERIRARRGGQVAAVAVARKIAALAWHLLTKQEDYAFGRPSLVSAKIRAAERTAGAARLPTRHAGPTTSATAARKATERELAERAEASYRRLAADWSASRPQQPRAGAGATQGHASQKPTTRQAARQPQAPEATL